MHKSLWYNEKKILICHYNALLTTHAHLSSGCPKVIFILDMISNDQKGIIWIIDYANDRNIYFE